MDLTGLKWTKNVRQQYGEGWGYQNIPYINESLYPGLRIFGLSWKDGQEKNANKPKEGELVILRQKSSVTHIVKLLNNDLYDDCSFHDFKSYRLVRVIWMADCWNSPPKVEKFFDCDIKYICFVVFPDEAETIKPSL